MARNDVDTTLGDINRLDRDNFDHIMKRDANTFKFATPKEAQHFMGLCVDKALRKCGIKIRPNMNGDRIARLMASRECKLEHRTYDDKEEAERVDKEGGTPYQTGLFVYSKNEITAYISSPFAYDGGVIMPGVYIKTTVKGVI
jgi:hypothetical protein